MALILSARPVLPGAAAGPILRLDQPVSFWGGVDPQSGRLTDPRGPHPGRSIAGHVLALRAARGSSSSSAVMLELIAHGLAPAAVLLGEIDAILGLGIVVAREMGHATPPLLELGAADHDALPDGASAVIEPDGTIRIG
jgi:predicted aconitase with swiveling domain